MSRRKELEHEVSLAQERIKKAPKDTPQRDTEDMGARVG